MKKRASKKEWERKWREKNPGKAASHIRKWRSNEENKKKERAHYLLRKALERGEVKKLPCKKCGEKKVDGHHHDYDQPLVVVWFCRLHHKEEHKRLANLK